MEVECGDSFSRIKLMERHVENSVEGKVSGKKSGAVR